MTSQELLAVVSMGEGYEAEFKIALPSKIRELTEEICAFANAAGGRLILGVSDNNTIVGITLDNSHLSRIQNGISEIKPRLNCTLEKVTIQDKTMLVITVPSGNSKPYILSGSVFMRMGPNTQKLTQPEELHDLFQQSGKIYFDEASVGNIDKKGISEQELQNFKALAGFDAALDREHLIENLQLQNQDGYLKNGAILFFTERPQHFFENSVVRCLLFAENSKRYILDDKTFEGSLYKQFLESMAWVKSKLNIGYDIEGQGSKPRKEVWEIPETAIKEALINALAHRNYYDKGGVITVELFNDRLEIGNPGGLVSAIPEKMFGRKSHSRNPLIFGLFARMRLVEKIGSGVPRMRALMKDANLPLPTFETEGSFTVTFYRPINFSRWVDRWVEKLSENRIKLLYIIYEKPEISKKEMEQKLSISSSAIDKNIEFLKKEGLISREGGAKGGQWKIHFIHPDGG